MLKRVKVNLELIESMHYFWVAASQKDNIAETFFYDVANMPAMKYGYDEEFNEESVRLVLSAIKNRELINGNKQEKRFWNFNMWVMEDMEYTNMMIQPIKQLNLDDVVAEVNTENPEFKEEEIELVFSLMRDEVAIREGNKLVINFFKVKPGDLNYETGEEDENTYIDKVEMKKFIKDKIIELF